MTKRCLIMAGGTGGHVFPGLAVANALRDEGWDIQWLGTPERMEAQVVPKYDIPIHFIPVKGLRGKGLGARMKGAFALVKSLLSARRIIKRINPDVVVGFGGYASGPGGVAAKSLGIPVIIHEQNAAAGMTNDKICPFVSSCHIIDKIANNHIGTLRTTACRINVYRTCVCVSLLYGFRISFSALVAN